jgi:two-component system nitrate/nitrite response regulator NarL
MIFNSNLKVLEKALDLSSFADNVFSMRASGSAADFNLAKYYALRILARKIRLQPKLSSQASSAGRVPTLIRGVTMGRRVVTIILGKNGLLREGLATILRSANFRVLASASSTDDLVPCKIRSRQALFLVVHTGIGFETVIEQIEHLRNKHPRARIVVMADRYRLPELVAAFRAGANGYFVDILSCDVFIKSLELVTLAQRAPAFLSFVLGPEGAQLRQQVGPSQENGLIPSAPTNDLIPSAPLAPQLSGREKSILRCLTEGDSNKGIARKFDIAEATVKVHVKAILRKIQVQNRTQAAVWGMNNEILTRRANGSSLLSSSDLSNPLARTSIFSGIEQIGASAPLVPIDQLRDHVEVPQMDRLARNNINRSTHNGVRPGK